MAAPGAARAWLYQLGAGVLLALLVSCRAAQTEPTRSSEEKSVSGVAGSGSRGAQLAAEPEQFRFVVPLPYLPHELRGEGSERVMAPRDAQVSAGARGIRVE